MKKSRRLISLTVLGTLLISPVAFAVEPVCVNSPENATALLGLLGAAAAGYPLLRDRARSFLRRRHPRPEAGVESEGGQ